MAGHGQNRCRSHHGSGVELSRGHYYRCCSHWPILLSTSNLLPLPHALVRGLAAILVGNAVVDAPVLGFEQHVPDLALPNENGGDDGEDNGDDGKV